MKKNKTILSAMKSSGAALAALLCALCAFAQAAGAQSLPFEDKARYEHALEQKVDGVLVRLLGPNQAKVVVEATMDFGRTEKMEVTSAASPEKGAFKWEGAGGDAQSESYLMPGFPAYGSGGSENKTYNRQMLYPSAFVKKMNVSIIVNRDLPDLEGANIRQVVSEMLVLDAKRGDQVSVIKAPFAPLWRTIWYTPEAISLVLKYVMLSLMAIIAMIVVAVGFLKLAGAMNTMAKVQQSHQITMELGKGGAPGGVEAGLPALGGLPRAAQAPGGEEAPAEEGGKVVFNINTAQVPFLVNMMVSEDPANVALVAGHLPEEVRGAFLKKLPPAFVSEVIANMAKIRFLEPEIITAIKDELERRLSGAVGGFEGALSAIGDVNLRAKRAMLAQLQKDHPELAAEVRRRILLPDDLTLLAEKDILLLVGAVKIEEWAIAMLDLPGALRQKIKGQMAENTWKMIEQSISYGAPTAEKMEEAVELILAKVAELIKEGRIADPLNGARLIASDQPAA
ncbi:MAG: FliG C-terminal domain-containing protein [Elusimicrobiota bacterium]|nr:FliG C-terminal domain-containing protein [Elusimicrobiota bacterium]